MPLQNQIEGVRSTMTKSQVAPTLHRTAAQVKARKDIKAAFEADGKQQWKIGDLLNVIAPRLPDGGSTDEEEAANTERLEEVAVDNDKLVKTLKVYRQIAAEIEAPIRMGASFGVFQALGTRDRFEEYKEADLPMKVAAVHEWLAEQREPQDPPTPEEVIGKLVDLFNKHFPVLDNDAPLPVLTEEGLTEARILRLGLDTLIGDRKAKKE